MYKKPKNDLVCKWTNCSAESLRFETPEELSRHVDEAHLEPCANEDLFFCLWEGCKVYNKPSYSFGWLKRHTKEKHTKERPNKCLMNGCNMAFNSIDALQRHMLRHFEQTPPPPVKAVQSNLRTVDGTPPTLLASPGGVGEEEGAATPSEVGSISSLGSQLKTSSRRRGYSLKVRIPRHSFTSVQKGPLVAFNGVHFHEGLDHKTMAVIKQTTRVFHSSHTDTSLTLSAQVIGRRKRKTDEAELLVRWKPRLLPDSWVPISSFKEKRVVSLSELPPGLLSSLVVHSNNSRKNKRKPGA